MAVETRAEGTAGKATLEVQNEAYTADNEYTSTGISFKSNKKVNKYRISGRCLWRIIGRDEARLCRRRRVWRSVESYKKIKFKLRIKRINHG